MKVLQKLSLTTRLMLAIVVCGLMPANVIGGLASRTASHRAEDIGQSCQAVAASVADLPEPISAGMRDGCKGA